VDAARDEHRRDHVLEAAVERAERPADALIELDLGGRQRAGAELVLEPQDAVAVGLPLPDARHAEQPDAAVARRAARHAARHEPVVCGAVGAEPLLAAQRPEAVAARRRAHRVGGRIAAALDLGDELCAVYPPFGVGLLELPEHLAAARIVAVEAQRADQTVRAGDAPGDAGLAVLVEQVHGRVTRALVEARLPEPRAVDLGEALARLGGQHHLGDVAVVGAARRDVGQVLAPLDHVGARAKAPARGRSEIAQPVEGRVVKPRPRDPGLQQRVFLEPVARESRQVFVESVSDRRGVVHRPASLLTRIAAVRIRVAG